MLGETLVGLVGDAGPYALLAGLFVLTAVLGQLISNTATALIIIPIAVAAAHRARHLAAAGADERGGRRGGLVPDAGRDAGEPDGDGAGRLPLRRLLEARPAADDLVLRRRRLPRAADLALCERTRGYRHDGSRRQETSIVSTGHLPPAERVRELVRGGVRAVPRGGDGGQRRRLPGPGAVPADLFGICVVGTTAPSTRAGDADEPFTIMSVSKPFVFALVCERAGRRGGARAARRQRHRPAVQLAGGDRARPGRSHQPDGELRAPSPRRAWSPATTASASGASSTTACRGSPAASCRSNEEVLRLRLGDQRPQPGASPGCCRARPHRAATRPRRSTSTPGSARLDVTAKDLAVMGATLADGGVNPLTARAGGGCRQLPAARWR